MIFRVLLYLAVLSIINAQCVHDVFASNTTKHYYEDLEEGRIMQTQNVGK